jgi:hypothetical protein
MLRLLLSSFKVSALILGDDVKLERQLRKTYLLYNLYWAQHESRICFKYWVTLIRSGNGKTE